MKPIITAGASLFESHQSELKKLARSLPKPARDGLWQLSEEDARLFLQAADSLMILFVHQTDAQEELMARLAIAAQKNLFSEELLLADSILAEYTEYRQLIHRCLDACAALQASLLKNIDPRPLWNTLFLLIQKGEALTQLLQIQK